MSMNSSTTSVTLKKAFDRVWHDGLWQVLRNVKIDEGIVEIVKALYESTSSAVLLNNQIGYFFPTTIGVRQGCVLSPILYNLFLEQIMLETFQDHHTSISINGGAICKLRFADDIDLLAGSNLELQELTNKLVERAGAYAMEISTEKSKVMVNSIKDTTTNITIGGQKLEEVEGFKYLGATFSKDGSCIADIRIRIATATAVISRLQKIFRSKSINFCTKYLLFKLLVVSILLFGCVAWTLLAEDERRIQVF